MKNNILCLILLAIFIPNIANAKDITMDETRRIELKVSQNGLRIKFDNDRIKRVFSFPKEINLDADEDLGHIFIYPDQPVNITLVTENKKYQDLRLVPVAKGIDVINIKEEMIEQDNSEINIEENNDISLKADIKNIINGNLSRFKEIPRNPGTTKYLIKRFEKNDKRYSVYKLEKFTDVFDYEKKYKAYSYFKKDNQFYFIVVS